jgi:hypothetical protein
MYRTLKVCHILTKQHRELKYSLECLGLYQMIKNFKKKKYFTVNKPQNFILRIEILGKIMSTIEYANKIICIILLNHEVSFDTTCFSRSIINKDLTS